MDFGQESHLLPLSLDYCNICEVLVGCLFRNSGGKTSIPLTPNIFNSL